MFAGRLRFIYLPHPQICGGEPQQDSAGIHFDSYLYTMACRDNWRMRSRLVLCLIRLLRLELLRIIGIERFQWNRILLRVSKISDKIKRRMNFYFHRIST